MAPYTQTAPVPAAGTVANPTLVPYRNHEQLWEIMVDVVDDYFEVDNEQPVRLVGGAITEGRLDTLPMVSATLLEPWRGDTVGMHERLESTLQSVRRYAKVRVFPAENGFWIDVAVFKELEDVRQPDNSTAGGATFRSDTSLTRVVSPIGPQETHQGWIELGRDAGLEQRILHQIHARLSGQSPVYGGALLLGQPTPSVRR